MEAIEIGLDGLSSAETLHRVPEEYHARLAASLMDTDPIKNEVKEGKDPETYHIVSINHPGDPGVVVNLSGGKAEVYDLTFWEGK